jgi:hypothetical protein
MTSCLVSSCSGEVVARSLCSRHYREWAKTQPRPVCSVEGCSSTAKSTGARLGSPMCVKHYTRWVRYGDSSVNNKLPRVDRCLVVGCKRNPREGGAAKQYCGLHYRRWYKHGDPLHIEYAPRGTGTTNARGYRVVFADGKSRQEHRVVAEQVLGRSLLPTENIHHRNGARSDNTAGPCLTLPKCTCVDGPHNLEMWSTMQPSGKRIPDLIAYAKEILRRYGRIS